MIALQLIESLGRPMASDKKTVVVVNVINVGPVCTFYGCSWEKMYDLQDCDVLQFSKRVW